MGRSTKAWPSLVIALLLVGGAVAVPIGQHGGAVEAGGGYNPSGDECQVLTLINRYRASRNEGKLVLSRPLGVAAADHTGDMARRKKLYHTPNLLTTVRQLGYDGTAVGENVASGYSSPQSVVSGWQESPGHRQNMLDGRFKAIGIAEQNGYWTTIFGNERDQTLSC